MHLYFLCAALIALANFVWLLIQSISGLHDEYLSVGVYTQYANLPILFIGLGLSIRAFQNRFPDKEWNYGSRFSTGIVVALLYSSFCVVNTIVYMQVINPNFGGSLVSFQMEQMREHQVSAAELDSAEAMMKRMLEPMPVALSTFLSTAVLGLLFSVLAPILFLRKTEPENRYLGAAL